MNDLLGLNFQPKDLGILQVCLRGIIVFLVAPIIVRLANLFLLSSHITIRTKELVAVEKSLPRHHARSALVAKLVCF